MRARAITDGGLRALFPALVSLATSACEPAALTQAPVAPASEPVRDAGAPPSFTTLPGAAPPASAAEGPVLDIVGPWIRLDGAYVMMVSAAVPDAQGLLPRLVDLLREEHDERVAHGAPSPETLTLIVDGREPPVVLRALRDSAVDAGFTDVRSAPPK